MAKPLGDSAEQLNIVRSSLRGFSSPRLHVAPHIPQCVLDAVFSSYAPDAKKEDVLLVYDSTFWGGADDGICITSGAVYWRNLGDDMRAYSIDAIVDVSPSECSVVVDGNSISLLSGGACVEAVARVIKSLSIASAPLDVELASAEGGIVPEGGAIGYGEDTSPERQSTFLEKDDRLKGRYVIERELGRGGMGSVFLARDSELNDRLVAVKLLLPRHNIRSEGCKLFGQEIAILASVEHGNIVKIKDQGLHDGLPYYVMEYVDGLTLSSLIRFAREATGARRPGKMNASRYLAPLAETPTAVKEAMSTGDLSDVDMYGPYWMAVVTIIRKLLAAVKHLHSIGDDGVAHLDIKPDNVMLTRRGRVVLMDFGISSTGVRGHRRVLVPGAPEYLPPELRHSEISRDIYGVGATLFTAVYLRRPEYADDNTRLVTPESEGLPESLKDVIRRSVSPNITERFRRASDFDETLRSLTDDGLKAPASEESPWDLLRKFFN